MVDEDASKPPQRVNVTIRVNLKYPDRDTFLERFSQNLSRTGIFIRAKDPVPVGTKIRFDYHLLDNTRVLRGVGLVRWVRTVDFASEPDQPPGMGIEFMDLDPRSEELVNEIVARHGEGALAPKRRLPKFAAGPANAGSGAAAAPPANLEKVNLDREEQGALDTLLGVVHDVLEPVAPCAPEPATPRTPARRAPPAQSGATAAGEQLEAETIVVLDLCGATARATLAGPQRVPDEAERSTVEARFALNGGTVEADPGGLPLPDLASWLGQRWPSAAAAAAARRIGVELRPTGDGSIGLVLDAQVVTVDDLLDAMVREALAPYFPLDAQSGAVVVLPSTGAARIAPAVKGILNRAGLGSVRLITEGAAMLGAAGLQLRPDEHAIALYVGTFESRLALMRGPATLVAALADPGAGLTEADFLATERAARALFQEHEIDVDDDPVLRDALSSQVTAKRRQASAEPLRLNVAGGIVEVSYESYCDWTAPVTERLTLLLDHLLRSQRLETEDLRGVVLGSDEPLWPGCAESVGHFAQADPTSLGQGPWCRVTGASGHGMQGLA